MDSSGFFITPSFEIESNNFKLLHSSETGYNELYVIELEGRNFVLKTLKKEYRDNPLYESLLRKEFEIGYSLKDNNICDTYSFKRFDSLGNVIVQEYIDGRTLDKYIEEENHTYGELKDITLQLCQALDYAHKKQIIHRDIKPQNIIITYNGDNVKLIDFGLSDTDYHSGLKIPAGTLNYASPEQIRGEA